MHLGNNYATDTARWRAIQARDRQADGYFVYCVKTTKIYCRPGCKARLARRANVIFHKTPSEARSDGYRPCKRCQPDLPSAPSHAETITQSCAVIGERVRLNQNFNLLELASRAGMSESHFHRSFKAFTGATPKAYAAQIRATINDAILTEMAMLQASIKSDEDVQVSSANHKYLCQPRPASVDDVKDHAEPMKQSVEFTIQPWQGFHVMIVVAGDVVCAIETADALPELIETLRLMFPYHEPRQSDWKPGETPRKTSHMLYSSIMNAIEAPCGRTLELPAAALPISAKSGSLKVAA